MTRTGCRSQARKVGAPASDSPLPRLPTRRPGLVPSSSGGWKRCLAQGGTQNPASAWSHHPVITSQPLWPQPRGKSGPLLAHPLASGRAEAQGGRGAQPEPEDQAGMCTQGAIFGCVRVPRWRGMLGGRRKRKMSVAGSEEGRFAQQPNHGQLGRPPQLSPLPQPRLRPRTPTAPTAWRVRPPGITSSSVSTEPSPGCWAGPWLGPPCSWGEPGPLWGCSPGGPRPCWLQRRGERGCVWGGGARRGGAVPPDLGPESRLSCW